MIPKLLVVALSKFECCKMERHIHSLVITRIDTGRRMENGALLNGFITDITMFHGVSGGKNKCIHVPTQNEILSLDVMRMAQQLVVVG